jgi:mono/diheme cytochrome c family protein
MRAANVLIGVFLAAAGTTTALVFGQPRLVPPQPPHAAPGAHADPQAIERGRYLAVVGDCMACHTRKAGERFAGGRPLKTPFGTILSANLTPDPETGIGRYNADQFYHALHDGVDNKGRQLYPAFPYDYFTNVSREDSDALFAYLSSLTPVRHQVDRNQLPFPFNLRPVVAFWNLLYLHKGPLAPVPSKSPQWNRGRYIVEGLGHCQACHTPRTFLGGPKRDKAFQGGTFADLFAPDITQNKRKGIGGWARKDVEQFLREAHNEYSGASVEMGEVVTFSLSQLDDADFAAMVEYLTDQPASPDTPVKAPDQTVMNEGHAIWEDECSACHRMNGEGVAGMFPRLKGNPNLQQSDPTTVLHFILAGTRRTATDKAPTRFGMPAFAWKLNDAQVAAVATYARNSWGNAAPAVDAKRVAELRKDLDLRLGRHENAHETDMTKAGSATWARAGTDSRDNGTPQAGREAPSEDAIGATGGSQGSGSTAGPSKDTGQKGSGAQKGSGGEKGHPAGVPTG